ncbi:hypothetical protein SNOG_14005 [Parastagonospora nodorum SN15]|uniref:Uncharacterized protein n=1 Tax=Phaeosphaeria nodorum (strain SN15 / ATCC MYA-4574 / FGSC 10173) TaxID=321614 RepID=Q0U2C8_PHANO|nr:hypothetical protein SNOG_14005 [Parastagonospora nodorum SN15]EAT78630.1 hypothetical protein SNOG_14005 [Parastagonospora nodorum SN15]
MQAAAQRGGGLVLLQEHLLKTSIEDPQYPSIESAIDSHTLHDPLNISDGIFFPAPRYHTYLTHLVIRLDMTIAHFDLSSCSTIPAFTTPGLETGLTRVEMEAMHHALQHKVRSIMAREGWEGWEVERKARHTLTNKLDQDAGVRNRVHDGIGSGCCWAEDAEVKALAECDVRYEALLAASRPCEDDS